MSLKYIVPLITLRRSVEEACFQIFKGKAKEVMTNLILGYVEDYIFDECERLEEDE